MPSTAAPATRCCVGWLIKGRWPLPESALEVLVVAGAVRACTKTATAAINTSTEAAIVMRIHGGLAARLLWRGWRLVGAPPGRVGRGVGGRVLLIRLLWARHGAGSVSQVGGAHRSALSMIDGRALHVTLK